MNIEADVAIVGGGLAGSMAAAMLGERGISCVVVDPHDTYPDDFRCEKIGGFHVAALQRTGLAAKLLPALTSECLVNDGKTWVSRYGYLLDRRPGDQYSFDYRSIVNAARGLAKGAVHWEVAKATSVATSDSTQRIHLSNGNTIDARLVVLANGLNIGPGHGLGIKREPLSPCHSITIGFDMAPAGGGRFPFGSLTHYAETIADRAAYITIFSIADRNRANVFVYRDLDDPLLREIRREPATIVRTLFPKLEKIIGPYTASGQVRVRPIDLYKAEGHLQPGLVLVGDAFATSCPAAGTGTFRVFTDVGQLCNVHIPSWLSSDGMGVEKISAFYHDPIKVACDDWSRAQAFDLKSLSVEDGLVWRARRLSRFGARLVQGKLRQLRHAFGNDGQSAGLRGRPSTTPSGEPAKLAVRRESVAR